MPKLSKEIKTALFYLLGILLAFITAILGIDAVNKKMDTDISKYSVETTQTTPAETN